MRSGAWALRCNACQIDVSLLGPTPTSSQGAATIARYYPPTRAAILRDKALLLLCVAVFGILITPTFLFVVSNDTAQRAAIIGVVAGIVAGVLFKTSRQVLACVVSLSIGAVLAIKPFVRPAMVEGRELSLSAETHLYFLIPGLLLLAIGAGMLPYAQNPPQAPPEISKALRIATGVALVVGGFVGQWAFGGPAVSDVLKQYEPQGAAMRKEFIQFAKSLPADGQAQPLEAKLDPVPVWKEGQPNQNNIEILLVEQLWNPDSTPKGRNLYLSDELLHSVQWTGPTNPMATSVMGERAGDFPERLTHAFGLPWLAAYRIGNFGLEVFVYDVRNDKLVAAVQTRGTVGELTRDRQLVLDTLARATGGTFQLR